MSPDLFLFFIVLYFGVLFHRMAFVEMSKRKQTEETPAVKRFKGNTDCVDRVILHWVSECSKVRVENAALLARIETMERERNVMLQNISLLEDQSIELDMRLNALEGVIARVLAKPEEERHAVEEAISEVRASGNFLMHDLDRILYNAETDTEEDEVDVPEEAREDLDELIRMMFGEE